MMPRTLETLHLGQFRALPALKETLVSKEEKNECVKNWS